MHIAALKGFEKLVKLLLSEGADVHAQSELWGTALQSASTGDNVSVVKLLIDVGADVNSLSGGGATALQRASSLGRKEVVELLLDRGANVNVIWGELCTALQAASYGGHELIVKLLLDRGAAVNTQGGRYGTALQAALTNGDSLPTMDKPDSRRRVVNLLLEAGADINAQGGQFVNALETALRHERFEVVELLLDKGADVNYSGGLYGSFVHSLAFSGRTLFLHKIRERFRPDLKRKDFHGWTILHLAARGGNLDTLDYLLDAGLDPAAIDEAGAGLLQYVASSGSMKLLDAVKNRGIMVPSDDGQWSPLHWACRAGNPEVVQRLLEHGYRSNYVTTNLPRKRWSPSSIAKLFGNGDTLDRLPDSSRSLLVLSDESVNVKRYEEPDLAEEVNTSHFCDGCFHVST